MTTIYRYAKVSDPYTTHTLATPPDSGCTELCTLDDGYTYVAVPVGVMLPDQPDEIAASVESVTITPELRDAIKAVSPHCRLISERMIEQIRARYSVDDELFYARIMIGAGAGLYELQAGEVEEVAAFKTHVETVREWGRQQRAALGL